MCSSATCDPDRKHLARLKDDGSVFPECIQVSLARTRETNNCSIDCEEQEGNDSSLLYPEQPQDPNSEKKKTGRKIGPSHFGHCKRYKFSAGRERKPTRALVLGADKIRSSTWKHPFWYRGVQAFSSRSHSARFAVPRKRNRRIICRPSRSGTDLPYEHTLEITSTLQRRPSLRLSLFHLFGTLPFTPRNQASKCQVS
ncbi:uncharacterized protein LY89DRAFT_96415 [Mollisia scopiformis]|uniref:Uncharacterized protein n=1 Tax=Mollisia scopiformis TaxID=149040 RepID=A0A194X6I3_MOLSC|nr:uncharacterized protein LY89DRAFT_96415 [Mollisia scopiformis]KUJ15796.1 hypothetical protein LY89DRAFT_96415 [Mollisia scopiformis]